MEALRQIRDYFWPFAKVAAVRHLDQLSDSMPTYMARNAGLYACMGIIYTHPWPNTVTAAVLLLVGIAGLLVYNTAALLQVLKKLDF